MTIHPSSFLPPPLKKVLKAISLELRHLLEGQYDASSNWQPGDLERRLAAIGVRRDREPVSVDELSHLSAGDQKARQVVDAYLKLRAEAGVSREDAVAEFVRETAYTWANRLLALRCMEARELIDEVILQKPAYGGRSLEHHRLARRQPEVCAGEDDGLLATLDKVFADKARHLPLLFDPDAPGVALKPSAPAIKRCVALLSGTEKANGGRQAPGDSQAEFDFADIFKAPDALGWAYQYWNTEEKDRVFTKVRTQKGAKIEGADIVPATQLYTESYMVKFLVQNSLGATWMGMHPESKLSEKWEYYVRDADRVERNEEAHAKAQSRKVEELTFLDPACGSGHFLLEAFDLFFDMYQEEVHLCALAPLREPSEICRSILERNLFGIDIDARAVQIAEAALWMKAAERVFPDEFPGVQTNLVAAVASHLKGPLWEEFLQTFDKEPHLRNVLARFGRAMEHIDELGSLARPEEALRAIVHDEHAKWEQARRARTDANYLFAEMRADALSGQLPLSELSDSEFGDRLLASVRSALDAFTEKARSEGLDSGRLLGRETQIGLRWIDVLGRKYDVVAANPPYMGSKNMSSTLRSLVEHHYSPGKRDLYAAFMVRCSGLTHEGGRVAVVVPQTWMFLKSFGELRFAAGDQKHPTSGILHDGTIESLAQLGRHAFDEVDPPSNVVLVAWRKSPPTDDHHCVCVRLTSSRPAAEQGSLLSEAAQSRLPSVVFRPAQVRFWTIPHAPIAYALSESLFDIVSDQPQIGRNGVGWLCVRDGMNTGNNERFVRFHWEHRCGGEWRPLSKGGGYRKWFGNDLYSVRWGDDAAAIRAAHLSGTALRNTERFFQPTLCYTLMGRGSLGVRLLDGSAFDGTGLVIDPVDVDSRVELAALLNTRVPSFLCRLFSQSPKFRGGYVERVPIPYDPVCRLKPLGAFAVAKKSALTSLSIVERAFDFTSLSACGSTLKEMAVCAVLHSAEGMIEANAGEMYHLSRTDLDSVYAETGQPIGLFSLLPGYTDLPEDAGAGEVPADLMPFLERQCREVSSSARLTELRASLRRWYERGPGPEIEEAETGDGDQNAEEDDDVGTYARIPIRPETFLEELSEKIAIHPISVFGLLKEGIERDGWRCLPEEQRVTRDRLTALTLQLLGHRWPRQIEASEPIPAWADPDGVIPLTEGTSERTLSERMKDEGERMKAEGRSGSSLILHPSSFADLMGKPLDQWLATEFFKHHTSQFKKRPIAWQVQSGKFTARKKPAFACLVYYHKLDGDLLPKLRKQYAGNLQQRMETELRGIEGIPAAARSDRQEARRNELGDQIQELQAFDAKLRKLQESAFSLKPLREGQPELSEHLYVPATQDAVLCLKQAWLRRLADAVQAGPLGNWCEAAREAAIHADLPGLIEVAMSQLDRHCTRVGPDDSAWDSADDPTPVTAARFICAEPSQMVTDALRYANGGWEGQVTTVVIAPLRQQISEKQDRQKAIKAELKASTDGDTTVHAIGELKAELDRLKAEIRDLQAQVDDIQARCDRLRAMITDWQCPGVEGWESWLAQQPLYDAISSVDGRRRPPTTAQEWIAQEQAYFPDINDGVRVNIAPLQKAGLLAADVLAKKDLDKAIADRAEWRRDERRWVREGRLPRPGWWAEGKDEG